MKVTILLDVPKESLQKCEKILRVPVYVRQTENADIQIGLDGFVPTESLKLVQTVSAGVDHLKFADFPKEVTFCSNAGAFADSVAQHAFALILSHTNKICKFDTQIRSGTYRKERVRTLDDQTLGILGHGGIGRSCARIARSLGMHVLAYTRTPSGGGNIDRYTEDPHELFRNSDILIISLPLTRSTRNFVNKDLLNEFRGDIIVNVARADIVSQDDLEKFLRENPSKYYLSDVWWNEPNIQYPLPENAVLTPHVGGISMESVEKALFRACENARKFMDGKPENVVDISEYA